MDSKEAAGTAQKPGPKPLQSNNPKTQYLILYNFVSAVLWLSVLGRVVLLVPLVGFSKVYPGVGNFAKWTQTLALLEVLHAAAGEFPGLGVQIPICILDELTMDVSQVSLEHRSVPRLCRLLAGFSSSGASSTISPSSPRAPDTRACWLHGALRKSSGTRTLF